MINRKAKIGDRMSGSEVFKEEGKIEELEDSLYISERKAVIPEWLQKAWIFY